MSPLATENREGAQFCRECGARLVTELEHLVIRYAEQLTASATTDEALDQALRKHLSERELVELSVTVALANATTRICNALKIEAD